MTSASSLQVVLFILFRNAFIRATLIMFLTREEKVQLKVQLCELVFDVC